MSRKLLAGTVLIGAGILTVVFGLRSPPLRYALSVSELLAHPVHEQLVRVQGTVVPESVCQEARGCGYRFRLTDGGSALPHALPAAPRRQLSVHYPACIVPDSFRLLPSLSLDLTVEGELCANCHRFEASQVLAKCPSTYPRHGGDDLGGLALPAPLCTTHWGDG